MVVMVFCQMSVQTSLNESKRAGLYRLPLALRTYNRNDREVCLILWVEYSQFFAFHLSLYTNSTTLSSPIMFSFLSITVFFFSLLKTSVIPYRQN